MGSLLPPICTNATKGRKEKTIQQAKKDSSTAKAKRSPLEPLLFTDGESAGQGVEKRPRPTEQPNSGLYPDSREEAHTFTGKILTERDCYTPSDKALTIRIKVTL